MNVNINVQIDTDDIFQRTTANEDREIVKSMLDKLNDDDIIDEVINRGLASNIFDYLTSNEQDKVAREYGFIRE